MKTDEENWEDEFLRIKDAMPRWFIEGYHKKEAFWCSLMQVLRPRTLSSDVKRIALSLFTTEERAYVTYEYVKKQVRSAHTCSDIRVASINSGKDYAALIKGATYAISNLAHPVDSQNNLIDFKNVPINPHLALQILPVIVDYIIPDNPPFNPKEEDVTHPNFFEFIKDCRERSNYSISGSRVPCYCVVNEAETQLRIFLALEGFHHDCEKKRVALPLYTSKELAEKAIDTLINATSLGRASSSKVVRRLGIDISLHEYVHAIKRGVEVIPDLPSYGLPEKFSFIDALRLPVIIDKVDFNEFQVTAFDNNETMTFSELTGKFPEIFGKVFTKSETMQYNGYTIFIIECDMFQGGQKKEFRGQVCKGVDLPCDAGRKQDYVCFTSSSFSKESVERRAKAWIDQQFAIDEKNRIKDERKAQREEQAEANKPFKWFVPRKLVGWSAYGAIENDGTIVKNSTEEMNYFVSIATVIGNLWDALGNRRWFVNGDIVKFIKHANVPDTRLDGLFFPYDCFYAIFENSSDPERRFMIRDRTIQYLRVVRVKSKQALKVVNALDIAPLFAPDKCIISIVTSTDSSKESFEGAIHIDINDSEKIPEGVGTPEEKAQIQRIVVALLLLYSGRVEIFKKYTIPRSQRYELNRGLANESKDNNEVITMMPLKKLVVEDSKPSDGTGSKKKTHMRGWCLDTLRHPRYRRNPDGTCKVRIRSPCVVNAIEE